MVLGIGPRTVFVFNFEQALQASRTWSRRGQSLSRQQPRRAVSRRSAARGHGSAMKVDMGLRLRVSRKVDIRLPGKGNSNSHGARPVH